MRHFLFIATIFFCINISAQDIVDNTVQTSSEPVAQVKAQFANKMIDQELALVSNAELENVRILNQKGETVFIAKLDRNKANLSSLDSGFYLACVCCEGKEVYRGVIKKL
jgi:hypothetical protein